MPVHPHFAWPFRRDANGKVVVVEQQSQDHITGQEYAVVVTPQGWRPERPEFGWPWPEFTTVPIDLGPLKQALKRFVPDSNANVYEWGEVVDQSIRHIRVEESVDPRNP